MGYNLQLILKLVILILKKKTKKVMKYLMNALPKTNIAPENGWLEY